MPFPADPVPDGAIFAPHHIYLGVAVAAVAAWRISDDFRDREPVGVVTGLSVALFGFALVWRYYPVTGAALSLGGLTLSAASLARPYWRHFPRSAAVVALGVAIAADDALEHSFGIWTPLDWLWKAHIAEVIV